MAPLPRAEFRSLLCGLNVTEFEQFVADLWRARGWDVETMTDERVIVATAADRDETRAFSIESESRLTDPRSATPPDGYDVDAVVTDTDDPSRVPLARLDDRDVAVIDADELYDLALYAIDRGACDDLFRTHFDRPAVVEEAEEVQEPLDSVQSTTDSDDSARVGHTGSVERHVRNLRYEVADAPSIRQSTYIVVGMGLVFLVLIAGILGGVTSSGYLFTIEDSDEDTTLPSTTTSIPTPTTDRAFQVQMSDAPTDTIPDPATPDVRSTRGEDNARSTIRGPFPPGMNESGITDPYILAAVHETALTNRSYTWLLTYREVVDGRPTATARETVHVEGPTVYRSSVQEVGPLRTYPNALGDFSTYANGSVRYEYTPDDPEARYRSCTLGQYSREQDRFANRAKTNLEYFLTVEETTITDAFERDGKRFYWVVFANDPWPGVQNTVGSALIDSTGVVHQLYRHYYHAVREEATITMTFRYTDIGTTTVEPPVWHSVAKNATRYCDELGDRIEIPPE